LVAVLIVLGIGFDFIQVLLRFRQLMEMSILGRDKEDKTKGLHPEKYSTTGSE